MTERFDEAYRSRLKREQAFFEEMAAAGHELSWAEEQVAAQHRQAARTGRFLDATGLRTATPATRVLEVGCGTGDYTARLVPATSATYVGLDATRGVFGHVRRAAPPRVLLAAGDAGALPFRDAVFDIVVGNAVLHHLPLDYALPELLRVMKPGGLFCFAEPNMANPHMFIALHWPWLRRKLRGSPDETAFYRRSLGRRLASEGFAGVSVEPFDFLYPMTPRPLIPVVQAVAPLFERLPLVREIAGSLLITARKPA